MERLEEKNQSTDKQEEQDLEVYDGQGHIFTAPLPDPISANVKMVSSIHNRGFKELPVHQQWIEKTARFFIKPEFLYCLFAGFVVWIVGSLLTRADYLPFDCPVFSWSGQGLDAAALLISTGVLVRQSRQENFAEQRAQLALQLNLLSEQKIAKIIALLEDLRNDLPNVEDRHDPEVQIMKEAADPVKVVQALQKSLKRELLPDCLPADSKDKH